MTPETEPKTLEQLRSEYDAATADFNSADDAHDAALEVLQDQIKHVREEFNQMYESVIAKWGAAKDRLTLADDTLRAAIVAQYEAAAKLDPKTSKTLGHGCSVQVRTNFEYENDEAVEWAEKNAPVLILRAVDPKGFKALLEKMKEKPKFVTVNFSISSVIKEV